jgi:hypothetical protein
MPKFKATASCNMSADRIKRYGKRLDELHKAHGSLTPELVVEDARPKNSPLHDYFCWNDTKAAHLYRLSQAGLLIRQIAIEVKTPTGGIVDVRAWHCVPVETVDASGGVRREKAYVSHDRVQKDDGLRRQLLDECVQWCGIFRRKFAALVEAGPVLSGIEEFERRLSARPKVSAAAAD